MRASSSAPTACAVFLPSPIRWDTRWDTHCQSADNAQVHMQHTKHSWTRAKQCTRTRARGGPAGTPTACPPTTPERALSARARAQLGTLHPRARGVEPMRWGARPQCAEDAWARRSPRSAHAKAQTVKYQARAAHSTVSG